jgi:hypothetical protein
MKINNTPENVQVEETEMVFDSSRRRFFQLAGGIAGAGLLLSAASCRRTPSSTTFLGAGDVALLNYLYIMKQVTAAFYTQAVATPFYGISLVETELQVDLRDQEIAHREFFKKLLAKDAVKEIATQLSAVTFADKKNFLSHATTLEDLSVAAYAGVIRVLTNTDYILTLSKIQSVDARHAGFVRDINTHNTFADGSLLDSNGLDKVIAPLAGMTLLEKYIETKFDKSKLPTF